MKPEPGVPSKPCLRQDCNTAERPFSVEMGGCGEKRRHVHLATAEHRHCNHWTNLTMPTALHRCCFSTKNIRKSAAWIACTPPRICVQSRARAPFSPIAVGYGRCGNTARSDLCWVATKLVVASLRKSLKRQGLLLPIMLCRACCNSSWTANVRRGHSLQNAVNYWTQSMRRRNNESVRCEHGIGLLHSPYIILENVRSPCRPFHCS
jgi:hypothetical protein